MFQVDNEHFQKLVSEAIDNIPEKYGKHIQNLAFIVEEEPSPEQRISNHLAHNETLLGLYEGVNLTRRGNYGMVLPDKITIFQKPIEHMVDDLEGLKKQIAETLWHEVAHYFGLDHDQIYKLQKRTII